MKRSDFDLAEFWEEHQTLIVLGGCITIAALNFAFGGSDALKQKFARDAQDNQAKDAQIRAESLFNEQGCVAQAISRKTRTNNFTSGDVAIDPASVNRSNPYGSPIVGSLVCSNDGSLYQADESGKLTLIGSSPKIRKFLTDKGFKAKSEQMRQTGINLLN